MRVSVIEILCSSRSIGIRLTAMEASMMAAVSRPENDPVSSGEFPTKETVPVVPASAISNPPQPPRSEEHTSELQSLMHSSYAVFSLTKNINLIFTTHIALRQREHQCYQPIPAR